MDRVKLISSAESGDDTPNQSNLRKEGEKRRKKGEGRRVSIKVARSLEMEKKPPKIKKQPTTGVTRSNSIADLKRGASPKELVEKEARRRQQTKSMRATSSTDLNKLQKKPSSELANENKEEGEEEKKEEEIEENKQKEEEEKKKSANKFKISKKTIKKCETAISCSASLVSVHAEKAMKSREETIKIGRKEAGSIMQYSQVIKTEDDNSLLGQVLYQSAEFIDVCGELHSSWCRNLERRITLPMKELHTITKSKDEKLTAEDISESLNSIIGFVGVYSNFFRVGHQKISESYDKISEYKSLVAFNEREKDAPRFEIGQKCSISLPEISIQGTLHKKGNIRHNWKARWFILYYHRLLYFNMNTDHVLKGQVLLENVSLSVSSARKFQFVLNIQTPSRVYFIAFPSENELKKWQQLISSAIIQRNYALPCSGSNVASKRIQISLVEPKIFSSSKLGNSKDGKNKFTIKLEQFLRQDMFSRYWRDFRAKEPTLMSWITEESNLSDLVTYALAFVPIVSQEEVADLEATIAKSEELSNQKSSSSSSYGLKRKLSGFGLKKENHSTSPSVEDLKRANNALLYKNANSAFTILVASEQMASAFVNCKTVMIQLFDFIENEKPPINPRQFHVFTELIIHLFRHRPNEVFLFLSENPHILEQLLVHIENEHCLRLLLSLWSYPQCEWKVDILNKLGVLAINRYILSDISLNEVDNLTVLIRELIRRHRLLTLRPEAALILNKMRDCENDKKQIDLEEGIQAFTPRNQRLSIKSPPLSPTSNNNNNNKSSSDEKNSNQNKNEEKSNDIHSSSSDNDNNSSNAANNNMNATEIFNKVRPRRESDVRRDWVDITWSGLDMDNDEYHNSPAFTLSDNSTSILLGGNNDHDFSDDLETDPSSTSSNAPKKPLPSIPLPKPAVSREHLNINAPNYMESKIAPFMTALKNRNNASIIISYALQSDNLNRSERATDLLISMLKICRSQESDEIEEEEEEQTTNNENNNNETTTKSPEQHKVVTSLSKTDIDKNSSEGEESEKDLSVTEKEKEKIQKAPHVIILELVKKFPIIAQLLRISKKSKSLPLLGIFRYNLIRIIRYVIDCGFKFVDRNLIESKLLSRCISLMFMYPNHSVLLSTMDEMITIIYTRSIHRQLCIKMIKKFHFSRKLMLVVKDNYQSINPQPICAHLINIANTMSANTAAQKILRKNKEWIEFLVDVVFPVMLDQYIDEEQIPARDSEKQKAEAEKWKKRWEEFNFLISV